MRPTRAGSRRTDLTALREVLQDRRSWAQLAIVTTGDNGSHFDARDGDILVEVECVPSGNRLTARLGSIAGGPGRGVWAIPPVGTEVIVVTPDGDLAFSPTIVCTLSTGYVPDDLDDTIVVMTNNLGDIAITPSGDLKLGSKNASESAVKGNTLLSVLNMLIGLLTAHTHKGPGETPAVFTGTPTTPFQPFTSSFLSTKVKVS